jgi:hypothetical protein
MKVRLTKKLAGQIDGIDLSGRHVGETIDLPSREARMLLAEQWAAPERRHRQESALNGRRDEDPRLVDRRGSPEYVCRSSSHDSSTESPAGRNPSRARDTE